MTFASRIPKVFRGEPHAGVVWQPRIDHWYRYHKRNGTLPKRYAAMSEMELCDDLGCSPRPYEYFNTCLQLRHPTGTTVQTHRGDNETVTVWSTPKGELRGRSTVTLDSWMPVEYPVKTMDDMDVMERVLAEQWYEFDMQAYRAACETVGDRAAPTLYIPRINVQRMFLDFMGVEPALYALADYPSRMRRFVSAIDASDEQMLAVVADCPIEVINFGDNVDGRYLGPRLFEAFLLGAYQRRSSVLRKAGKWVFAHWDGHVGPILQYARQTGMNGIEAITPLPQGDVTLEEAREALGDEMVLLDGIPMLSFMPDADVKTLQHEVARIVELFWPRLILGVSDEISPVCDIEKIRLVSELASTLRG